MRWRSYLLRRFVFLFTLIPTLSFKGGHSVTFWNPQRRQMMKLKHEVEQFYDTSTDFPEMNRLNKSTVEELDNLITAKLNKFVAHGRRHDSAYRKISELDISVQRLRAGIKSFNVVIMGLKYASNLDVVRQQLSVLYKHMGMTFDERIIHGMDQLRLLVNPTSSRLVLTFIKAKYKQAVLIKFRIALNKYERKYRLRVASNNRKLRIPELEDCAIYVQDDIDKYSKTILLELKKLKNSYPNLLNVYVKDSRIYYKLRNETRPVNIIRKEKLRVLAVKLERMSRNKSSLIVPPVKIFRSQTVFPYEYYTTEQIEYYDMLA